MYLIGACVTWVGGKGRNKNYVLTIMRVYKMLRTFVIEVVANSNRFRNSHKTYNYWSSSPVKAVAFHT